MTGYTHLFAVIRDGNLVIEGHSNVALTRDLLTIPAGGTLLGGNFRLVLRLATASQAPFLFSTEADLSPFGPSLETIGRAIEAVLDAAA